MTNPNKIARVYFLLSLTFSITVVVARPVSAKTTCQPTPQGQLCISQVDFTSFAQEAYGNQDRSQWCWAASISMVFRYYKHPVSQDRIVEAVYGRKVNLPSGSGWNIASQVNRDWQDDNGKKFSSRLTAAYDFDARVMAVDNNWIINQLHEDRPIIIGTAGHAVVGTAIQYYVTPNGPYVTSIGVFDPWPGRGARGLSPLEMVDMGRGGSLRFLATVRVSDQ
jgi:hypothetical protein